MYLGVKLHRKQLAVIAPQLHLIMTALIHGVPFLPIVYDNKVGSLLEQASIPAAQQLPLVGVTEAGLQAFVDNFFGGSKA